MYLLDLTKASRTWAHHEELLVFGQLPESGKTQSHIESEAYSKISTNRQCALDLSPISHFCSCPNVHTAKKGKFFLRADKLAETLKFLFTQAFTLTWSNVLIDGERPPWTQKICRKKTNLVWTTWLHWVYFYYFYYVWVFETLRGSEVLGSEVFGSEFSGSEVWVFITSVDLGIEQGGFTGMTER